MFKICSLLSPHQNTPLHMAADNRHTDVVQCLIDKGAGINIRNEDGVSESDCNADLSLSTQVPGKNEGRLGTRLMIVYPTTF